LHRTATKTAPSSRRHCGPESAGAAADKPAPATLGMKERRASIFC
jgi:hypothetical protein